MQFSRLQRCDLTGSSYGAAMDQHGQRPPLVVVMGVAGAGKTLIGRMLAERLRVDYVDADALHPPENIAKLTQGTPLEDHDRWPWLGAVGAWLSARRERGAVASCSALRRAYRDVLRQAAPELRWLHLHGEPALIHARLAVRSDHFMPASLIASQLALLEPLEPDERGVVLDVGASPSELVDAFVARL